MEPRGVGNCLNMIFGMEVAAVRSERDVRVRVTKLMTWECAPEYYRSAYPEAQPVRFRYVENSHYEEVVSGRALCDQLKREGKTIVPVEFELSGDGIRGLRYFHVVTVDGTAIADVGGWGSSGGDGAGGVYPLDVAFKAIVPNGSKHEEKR